MIVDGVHIAAQMFDSLRTYIKNNDPGPRLTVFTAAPNAATQQYLRIKMRRAQDVGVALDVRDLSAACTTADVTAAIKQAVLHTDGIVIQLPFPATVDVTAILDAVPSEYDVDAIGPHAAGVLPPVVRAIERIADESGYTFTGRRVVVIGRGRLVGKPAAEWLEQAGADVQTLDRDSDITMHTREADVIVLGAGVPGILTPEMIQDGVAIFDAGTSEDGGKLVGDADPACAEKAVLFTPVPGGIGPITIAALLENLLVLQYGYRPE